MFLFTSSARNQGGFSLPPVLVGAHRHWRVLITSNDAGNLVSSILELEMYATRFGANRCVGGTASADSSIGVNYPAADAFDQVLRDIGNGTGDNLWASANSALPHWIGYDFAVGNEVEINAIGIFARQPTFLTQVPTEFEVQHSDNGTDWTTAWMETGVTWSGFEYKRFVNPNYTEPGYTGSPHGAHTYWRFHSMRADADDAVALAEMQFRASPGGADQATGGTPTASSLWDGSLGPANAFDDNAGTLWSAANNSDWAWLQYQFASPVEVAEVAITARNDVAANTSPGEFAIQYSDDGVTWTTVFGVVGATGWGLGETRVYTDANYVEP